MGLAAGVVTAVAVGVAGCGAEGGYELGWRFSDQAEGEPTSARECSLRGVDAIALLAENEDGDGDDGVFPCGGAAVVRRVPVGFWRLLVVALDRRGRVKEPAESSPLLKGRAEFHVAEDAVAAVTVELPPQPQCRDGVDNDGDGAADLADAACRPGPDTPSESPLP